MQKIKTLLKINLKNVKADLFTSKTQKKTVCWHKNKFFKFILARWKTTIFGATKQFMLRKTEDCAENQILGSLLKKELKNCLRLK